MPCCKRGERREQVSGSDPERAEAQPAGLGDYQRDRQRSGQEEASEQIAQGVSVCIRSLISMRGQGVTVPPWSLATYVYSRHDPL